LEWDEAGNVTTAFAPDFYLPEQDLYIELTTLRPSLATKKNYKQRRMAELYPEVNLILLKRRDIRNLMLKFGLDQQAQGIIGTGAQKGSQNER
jgi:hypoxanthine phosphoribosyltransferase